MTVPGGGRVWYAAPSRWRDRKDRSGPPTVANSNVPLAELGGDLVAAEAVRAAWAPWIDQEGRSCR